MIRIGFVGVGDISGIYLKNITGLFREIEIAGICDIVREKAEKAAEEYNIAKIYDDMYELFADPSVDIVLNITRPYEHYAVTRAALEAGKHVYSEKPLAATLAEGMELVQLAEEKGLLLGGAPDTFMGAGIQTCRKLIDAEAIGEPVGAAARMLCRGHETWHPDPAFYYQHGGGPMLDMGPYYITALLNLLGPVQSVTGVTKISFPQRLITSEPKKGTVIAVEVPTYVTGILQFANDAVGTVTTTFDVYPPDYHCIEIYGSEGTLLVPDPNCFGGKVLLKKGKGDFEEQALCFPYVENSRALGLADMAKALETGGAFRADCRQTLHCLEVMTAVERSSLEGRRIDILSPYTRRAPMDTALPTGILG